MTEKELQYRTGKYFSKNFNVEYEVWSEDMKSRIDIVLVHKSDTKILYPFGIELKKADMKKGKNIANWIKQGMTYSKKEFKGYGKLIILLAPQLSYEYMKEGNNVHSHELDGMKQHCNVNTMLGQFGLGETMKLSRFNTSTRQHKETICFVFSGNILYEFDNDLVNLDKIQNICK